MIHALGLIVLIILIVIVGSVLYGLVFPDPGARPFDFGRAGEALYVLGCAIGALFAIIGAFLAALGSLPVFIVGAFVIAAFAWLVGWACRYVLAGGPGTRER
jgi:hypothetical protein